MVKTTLPLPILKYLEMEPEVLDRIVQDYPFYLYPRLAQILNKNKFEDSEPNQFNFFGFNEVKLSHYINCFRTFKFSPISGIEETNDIIVSSEPEVSFHDVNIDIVDDSNVNFDISHEDKILNSNSTIDIKEDSLNLENSSSPEEQVSPEASASEFELESIENKEDLVNDNNESSLEINKEFSILKDPLEIDVISEDTASEEELSDKIALNNDIEDSIEIPELEQLIDRNLEDKEPLNFEIDLSDTISDEELAMKLSNAEVENIIDNEEVDEAVLSSIPIKTEIEKDEVNVIELELDQINSEVIESELDDSIEFDIKKEVNYIQPGAFELLNLNEEGTKDQFMDHAIDKEDERILDQSNESSESEIKDFTTWLASFTQNSKSTQNNDNELAIHTEEEKDDEELNRVIQTSSAQHLILDTIKEDIIIPKINRDDELEGILKDNFFKTQVEIKKSSRKTPSELRIQDEAQLSLQPLDLISETMAVLHDKQGNKNKAIEIYEKLIALFPEKSSFFALQIENLRK